MLAAVLLLSLASLASVQDRKKAAATRAEPSLWWNGEKLLSGASAQLRARAARKTILYLASSGDRGLADVTRRLAEVLEAGAYPALEWHYDPLPNEKHSTIYHPAALRAFRLLFKPDMSGQGR